LRNVLDGHALGSHVRDGRRMVLAGHALANFPVALLEPRRP
jgi:hypothetical protein